MTNVVQSESALFSIEICYIRLPVIICISIIILMSFYKLDGIRGEMSRVKLKIPAETQTGKLFRVRGKGVPSPRGGYAGDLICKVVIETPVSLNEEQKELLRKLEESLEGKGQHRPKHEGFFQGVKKFFDNLGK